MRARAQLAGVAAVAAAGAGFVYAFGQAWLLSIAFFTLMFAVCATSWNIVGGYAGYPSLGHAAFFGLGAYAEAVWFEHHSAGAGLPMFAVVPFVALAVAAAALPIGWVVMRVRADVFAIVTITFLFVVQTLAENLGSITGGSQGIQLPLPTIAAATYNRPFCLAMLGLLVAALLASLAVEHSRLGLALAAVRDDEDKARAAGVPVLAAKLTAFAASAGLVAAAGAVWAAFLGSVYPTTAVDPLLAVGMVLMAYLGGRATLFGPLLGALVLESAHQYLLYRYGSSQLYLLAYALVFLAVMLVMPRGVLLQFRRAPRRAEEP